MTKLKKPPFKKKVAPLVLTKKEPPVLNNTPNVLETERQKEIYREQRMIAKLLGQEFVARLRAAVGQIIASPRNSLVMTLKGFDVMEHAGFRVSKNGRLLPHNSGIPTPRYDDECKLLGLTRRKSKAESLILGMSAALEEKEQQKNAKALEGGLDTPINRRFRDSFAAIHGSTRAFLSHPSSSRTQKEQDLHIALGNAVLTLAEGYKISLDEFFLTMVPAERRGMLSRCADPDLSVKYTLFDFDTIENRVSRRYLRRYKAGKEQLTQEYNEKLALSGRLSMETSPEQIQHLAAYCKLIAEERRKLQLAARYARLEMERLIIARRRRPGFIMPRPLRIDVDIFGEPFVHNTGLDTIPFPVFTIGHYPSLAACQSYADTDIFIDRARSASFIKNKAIFDTFETGRFEALTAPGS